ncbi:MAG: hypothetical protein QOD53_1360 [Thermoleophilaceae bacterium]|nr:hypothetical protein [Thermoleophilaceae bacterium]
MLCTQCAVASYSAAAKTLVERGQPCPACGGALALGPPEPVGVAASADEPESAEAVRRFQRESG